MNKKSIFDVNRVNNWIKFSIIASNENGEYTSKRSLKASSVSCMIVNKLKDFTKLIIAEKGTIKQVHKFDSYDEAIEFCDIWIDIIGDDNVVEHYDSSLGKHMFFNKDGINEIIDKPSSDGKCINLVILVDALDGTNGKVGFVQNIIFPDSESSGLFSDEFLY